MILRNRLNYSALSGCLDRSRLLSAQDMVQSESAHSRAIREIGWLAFANIKQFTVTGSAELCRSKR